MLTKDFTYHLPPELIAQNPISPRDHSRLMVLNRKNKTIQHTYFYELPKILQSTDVLVFNQSKVIPARLFGHISQRRVEILLLKPISPNRYQILAKPGKKFQPGTTIKFSPNFSAEVIKALVGPNPAQRGRSELIQQSQMRAHPAERDERAASEGLGLVGPNPKRSELIQIEFNLTGPELEKAIEKYGHAPLPPYIKHSSATLPQYQTIYAKDKGSVAAPTAGLHFTSSLLKKITHQGIQNEFVTLHVGLGTFAPVKTPNIKDHPMHSENFSLSATTAKHLNQAKKQGKRIIAVGTTSTRILETCAKPNQVNPLHAQSGETKIFIYPGYHWKFIDGLITNFHLSKSTLLMLISAFAGKEFITQAYQEAIQKKYRFYSFGDAMLIL